MTRVARVAAMRHRSTELRQCTLLALARRGTEKIETKSVHKGMYKKRLQIELQPDAANSSSCDAYGARCSDALPLHCATSVALLAPTLRSAATIESNNVHNVTHKERLQI